MSEQDEIEWVDVDASAYTADSTQIGDLTVSVCLDDEGPLRPAYFWWIESAHIPGETYRVTDGWASSPEQAKSDAVDMARSIIEAGPA